MLHRHAGVAIGGLGGWKGSVQIPEGGDATFRQMLRPVSPLARLPQGADSVLHVNSFDVKYRSDGSEEQFVSDLSVWAPDGREVQRREIRVNTPLRFQACSPMAFLRVACGRLACSSMLCSAPVKP